MPNSKRRKHQLRATRKRLEIIKKKLQNQRQRSLTELWEDGEERDKENFQREESPKYPSTPNSPYKTVSSGEEAFCENKAVPEGGAGWLGGLYGWCQLGTHAVTQVTLDFCC